MKYLLLAAFVGGIVVVMIWWIWFIELRDLRPEGRAPDPADPSGAGPVRITETPGTTAVASSADSGGGPAESLGTAGRPAASRAHEKVIAGLRGAGAGGGTLPMTGRQVRYTAGPDGRVIVVTVLSGLNVRIAAGPASVALLACMWHAESTQVPACQDARDDPVTLGHG
jgi:hypothetical protein